MFLPKCVILLVWVKRRSAMKILFRNLFMLFVVIGIAITISNTDVYASNYRTIVISENKKPVKTGKYYTKVRDNKILYSKKKKSGYKSATDSTRLYNKYATNGVFIIYPNNQDRASYLQSYNMNTGETKVLTGYSVPDYYHAGSSAIFLSAAYKNKIYYVYWNMTTKYDFYQYDMKSGQNKLLKSWFDINVQKGKYFIGGSTSEISPDNLAIYKFTNDGIKCIRKLGAYGNGYSVYGNYFYYIKTDRIGTKGTIYKVNVNGKKKPKKLASYKGGYVSKVTNKGYKITIAGKEKYRRY